jgi:hypothetical protein
MISNELSSIQHNQSAQAMLDAAKAEFLAHGGSIQVVSISRSLFNPVPFNSESLVPGVDRPTDRAADANSKVSQANKQIRIQKSAKAKAFEADIAEKLKAYYDRGVVAAAKDLHLSVRRINYIALAHGIKFANRQSAAAQQEERELAPKIREMAERGMSQQAIADELKMGRQTVRRIASTVSIRFRSLASIHHDQQMLERIKALRDIGVTRATCARQLEINPKVLLRLLAEYQISYPLSVQARQCAA